MGKGKRDNEKEPVPTFHHWRQEFVIDKKNNVRIINKASELDVDRNIPVSGNDDDSIVTKLDNQGCIVLGKLRDQLNMIALQPKQDGRATSDGVLPSLSWLEGGWWYVRDHKDLIKQ